MAYRPGWWRRLAGLWRQNELDRGLDDEVAFHIEQQTAKNIELGMPPDEARRAALVRFGGVEPLKERTRDEFRPAILQDFWRDMRIGARMLRRSPGFAAATILTIGLGTGAATAVFSVVNGVLLRPLPFPESDRLVRLFQLDSKGKRNNVSGMNFDDWQARTHSFGAMAKYNSWGLVPAIGGSEPTLAVTSVVSREFFDVMQVRPWKGRAFSPAEQRVGGVPAAIIGYGFWRRWLDGAELDGKALRMGDRLYPVIGVMPAGFDYPNGTAVWLARELNPPDTSRTAHNFQAVARLRDEVTLESAQADISSVSRQLKQQYGDDTWMFDAAAVPVLEQLTATSKPALRLLFGAAIVLLLVATTNVSSLLLARGAARQQQFAVQLAIGAGRFRIARQLLAETTVLCLVGGILGVVTAIWMVRALVSLGPGVAPRLDEASVDWMALAFALGVSMIAAVGLGVVTTFGTRGVSLSSTLSEGSRSGTGGRRSFFVRQTLVVAQVALTLVLLAGSGLLARSFIAIMAIDPGFKLDDALLVDLTVADGGPDFRPRRVQQLDSILERVRQLPGVTAAGLITGFPLGGGNNSNGQFLELASPNEISTREQYMKLGKALAKDRAGFAGFRLASPGYFEAMGIPLLRGRLLEASDGLESPHVAVISQSLARARWPDRDPIGRFVQFGNMDGDMQAFRIVGVVGDVRELPPESLPGALLYASYRQRPNSVWRLSVVVRGQAPEVLQPSVRRVVREINPELPIQFRSVSEAYSTALTSRRFSLVLIAVFSGAALLLATFGLYGLISYLVAQRTREIGIRMALGARSSDLLRLIVGKGARLAIYGTAAGLVAAFLLSSVVQGLLYGITPTDPNVLASVAAVTIAASVGASYFPARRATRIEPVNSLRAQ
ncbi:MAG: ADOP family duplicated permease [Acidobacteriota bacterium]